METCGTTRKRHIGGASALDCCRASGEAQIEFRSPVSIWGWRYIPLDALILCVCVHVSCLCKCVYVSYVCLRYVSGILLCVCGLVAHVFVYMFVTFLGS